MSLSDSYNGTEVSEINVHATSSHPTSPSPSDRINIRRDQPCGYRPLFSMPLIEGAGHWEWRRTGLCRPPLSAFIIMCLNASQSEGAWLQVSRWVRSVDEKCFFLFKIDRIILCNAKVSTFSFPCIMCIDNSKAFISWNYNRTGHIKLLYSDSTVCQLIASLLRLLLLRQSWCLNERWLMPPLNLSTIKVNRWGWWTIIITHSKL